MESAYAESKLAINMFTKELQRKLNSTNITAHAVLPRFVKTLLARYAQSGKTFVATFGIRLAKSAAEDKCEHD